MTAARRTPPTLGLLFGLSLLACRHTPCFGSDCAGADECDDSINACTTDNVAVTCGANGPQRVVRRTTCSSTETCVRGPGTSGRAFCARAPLETCADAAVTSCSPDGRAVLTCEQSRDGLVVVEGPCVQSDAKCVSVSPTLAYCR